VTKRASPKRRRVACSPPPCGTVDPLALLSRAKARGLLSDDQLDLALRLMLRRLVPQVVTK
jgi:hypothetical protein